MKVFIVFKGYWIFEAQVYKVFLDKNKAVQCVEELIIDSNVRAYFEEYEVEVSE